MEQLKPYWWDKWVIPNKEALGYSLRPNAPDSIKAAFQAYMAEID